MSRRSRRRSRRWPGAGARPTSGWRGGGVAGTAAARAVPRSPPAPRTARRRRWRSQPSEDELDLVDGGLAARRQLRDVDQEIAPLLRLDADRLVLRDGRAVLELPAILAGVTRRLVVVARIHGYGESGRRRRDTDFRVRLGLAG